MAETSHGAPQTRGSVIRWARLYDLLTNLAGMGADSAIRKAIIEHAAPTPGEHVLDVGCGTGIQALRAKDRVGPDGDVQGIDASPEMIGLAQEKAAKAGAGVVFQTGVAEQLAFPDGTFDLVLNTFMLHHLPDDVKRQAFTEIARVLKPGGRLLAVDLSGGGSWLWRAFSTFIRHRLPAGYPQHLRDMIAEAGLAPEALEAGFRQYVFIRARKAG